MDYNKFITQCVKSMKKNLDSNLQIEDLKNKIRQKNLNEIEMDRLDKFVDYRLQHMNSITFFTLFIGAVATLNTISTIVNDIVFSTLILCMIIGLSIKIIRDIDKHSEEKTLLIKIAIEEEKKERIISAKNDKKIILLS